MPPLEPNEHVIDRYRLSPISLVPAFVTALALFIGAGISASLAFMVIVPAWVTTFLLAAAVLTFFAIASIIIGLLVFFRTALWLTNLHAETVIQHGLFGEDLTQLSWSRITDVKGTRRGVFGTIFNYGRVTVATLGGDDFFEFYPVSRPEEVAAAVTQAHESFVSLNPGREL